MANRRLYNEKSFIVKEVIDVNQQVWHLIGIFTDGSIVSIHDRQYSIRVEPDPRWKSARKVAFRADSVYECESIGYRSRRHVYGSGRWYISPYRPGNKWSLDNPEKFTFEDFEVKR